MATPFDYKPLEQDYRIWLVVNPSVWLMPILFAVLLIALVVHSYAINLPGRGFAGPAPVVAPAVVVAPAPAG